MANCLPEPLAASKGRALICEGTAFSCINVERELHRSIVNPGQRRDFRLQRKPHKNDIAPLPFPLPALLKHYWYIKRGERVRVRGHAPVYATLGYSFSSNPREKGDAALQEAVRETKNWPDGVESCSGANNPKGIATSSPRLRGTSYLGKTSRQNDNRNAVAATSRGSCSVPNVF